MIAIVAVFLLSSAPVHRPNPHVILPNDRVIRVELAINEEERAIGLMFRESLPEDRGMLFLFPSCAQHPFWMKNCFFPLDLIWMDEDGTVLAVVSDAPPCRDEDCPQYAPDVAACYVLEINGGLAKKWNIERGSQLRIEEVPRVRIHN